jgi:hypothetical protein
MADADRVLAFAPLAEARCFLLPYYHLVLQRGLPPRNSLFVRRWGMDALNAVGSVASIIGLIVALYSL